jgi:hypothetical protein
VALVAVAGARRTATAYDRLVHASGWPELRLRVINRPGAAERIQADPAVNASWLTRVVTGRVDGAPALAYLSVAIGPDRPESLFRPDARGGTSS